MQTFKTNQPTHATDNGSLGILFWQMCNLIHLIVMLLELNHRKLRVKQTKMHILILSLILLDNTEKERKYRKSKAVSMGWQTLKQISSPGTELEFVPKISVTCFSNTSCLLLRFHLTMLLLATLQAMDSSSQEYKSTRYEVIAQERKCVSSTGCLVICWTTLPVMIFLLA